MNELGDRASGRLTDRSLIQVVAGLRVAIAIGIAAYGSASTPPPGSNTVWFLLVGLVWLPWASVLLLASDDHHGGFVVGGGALGDALIVFAAQRLIPESAPLILAGYAVVVGLSAVFWTRRGAWAMAGLSLLLAGSAQTDPPLLALLAVTLIATIVAVRLCLGHRLAVASSHHLQLKADTILDSVADGIIVTDSAGKVLQCNRAGERLIGSRFPVGASCERAVGLRTADGPLDCSQGCALLRLGHHGDGAGREVWRERSDGRRQSLLASVSVVGDDRDGLTEVVHSLRDITRLKEADEAKTLFLATASHELKTPLTVISGFADAMLAFPEMSEEQRLEALESIHARAVELGGIIERLLLSSKIEAGRAETNPRHVEVVPLLRQRGNAVQTATGRPIVMQLRDRGLHVEVDPLALGTVVDHLLENAIKYSEGGFVALAAETVGDGVAISVRDSGIGMDEEQARHCFDKFWQAESTDVRRFGGTGIGLYIVKSLVTAMGGTIAVKSAPGRGSRFTVWLPAATSVRPGQVTDEHRQPGIGDPSSIKEFMRQIGVPSKAAS